MAGADIAAGAGVATAVSPGTAERSTAKEQVPSPEPVREAQDDPPLAAPAIDRRQPSAKDAHSMAMTLEEAPEAPGGRGFVWGFALVSLVALGAVSIYARHADLAAAVPRLSDPLAQYVAMVNRGREAIAETVAEWMPDK